MCWASYVDYLCQIVLVYLRVTFCAVNRFQNELIVAVGKGEPAAVMSDYGFR